MAGTNPMPAVAAPSVPGGTNRPSTTTSPRLGVTRPKIARKVLDLPQPLWPTSATTSPGATRTCTSVTTTRRPYATSSPATERRSDGRCARAGPDQIGAMSTDSTSMSGA